MKNFFTLKRIAALFFVLYTSLAFAHSPVIILSGGPTSSHATIKRTHLHDLAFAIGGQHLKAQHKKSIAFGNPVPTSPTITGFSPSSGPVGTSVIISGANFNTTKTSNIVFFGATRATVTEATESSLTVTVPVGATYQPISVLDGDTKLTGYSASPFIITFSPNNSSIVKADFFSQLDLSPASSSTAQFMTTGDLDGDGKVDMVSVNSDAGTNNVSIFRNISSSGTLTAASFAAKIQLSLNGAPAGIAIGDLNGDGKPELITLDASGISVFLNTSNGNGISFGPKIDLTMLNGVSVSVGDLDNDGRADIVVSDRKDGAVFVFRNTSTTGNLTFANAIPAATFATGGGGPESVAIGDLDGDGKADMTVPNKVSGLVSVFSNISTPGNIAFGTAIVLTAGTKPVKAALGDFNADGKPDLVVANSTSSNVSVFQNTSSVGNISFALKADLPGDTKITTVAVADIDGDGKVDIVSVAVNGGGVVSVFRNIYTSGAISVSSFASKSLLNNLLNDVTIGDIDGDGRPDLVGTNQKVITVLRYNPFNTKVSDAFSGKRMATMDLAILADPVPSVSTYRFRVTQGTNIQTIDVQTNSFKFTQLASYAYNTSYSIDVQVQAGGIWSDYGAAGVVTTPLPLTQVSEPFRGMALVSIDSAVTADLLPPATGYRFRITKDAAVQTIDVPTNSFKFTQLDNYAPNTAYSIDVQAMLYGNWTDYGTAYVVSTPGITTQISASFSGKTLLNIDSVITADPVPTATGYLFRVTKNASVQTVDAPSNSFKMKDLPDYTYDTKYGLDVAVKTDATLGAFGPVSFVTTPVVPITQVTASYCGATLTDLDGAVRADALPLATVYHFRIRQGSNEQIIEETVPQTLLYKTTFYAYNATYTVDVSAYVNNAWTDYGAACNVTTLANPITQVSLINCGKILTTNDGQISLDHVPTATAYRLKITANGQTDYLDEPTNFARLGAMPSYEFNTTYSVQVTALVNDVWTPYGPACNVTTPVLVPQISTEMCGTVLTTVDGEIHEDLIPATMFSFIVTDGVHIDTLQSQVGSIRLSSVPFYAYNTVFSVKVAVMRNGVWTDYGPSCNVTTTNAILVTEVGSAYCGKVLTTNDGEIHADDLPLATSYRFKVTLNGQTEFLDAPTSFIRLAVLSSYAFNTTYSIQVSAMINGVWTGYGAACDVTTPAPLTQLSSSYCGTVLPVWNAQVQADLVDFANAYQFRITQGTHEQIILSATNKLRLSDVTFFAFNTPFSIQVAAKEGNALAAYGTACIVTTPAALTNADLSALTLSTGTLTPVFDSGTLTYTALVSNAVTSIKLSPRVSDATATIKINDTPVVSGSQSGNISLVVGPNIIATVVTAQDGTTTKSYNTTVTRDKTAQVITFNALPAKIYGDADFDPAATSNAGILVTYASSNTAVATIVSGQIHIIKAGTCTITASQGGDETHYAATDVAKQLTIGKAALTVTADNKSSTYGQALPALTVSYDGFVNGDTENSLTTAATAGTTAATASPVNTYPITASGAVDNNYAITYTNGTLTIGQATLTVTADNKNSIYGQALPALTVSYDGFVNGDTESSLTTAATAGTTVTLASPVNTYPITASGAVDNNYVITYADGTLTIGQATLTITADNKGSTYGQALPALTVSYDGFVNGDTESSLTTAATAGTTASPASPVNTYPITASGAVDNNYAITYADGTLTIGQATLTITADNKSSTYGQTLPALTVSYDGFVNGDTENSLTTAATAGTTATLASPVNTYPITASGAVDNNYAITYADGTLTIGQAALTITADNKSSTYGQALPALTVSYDGFVNGDTQNSLTIPATASTTATAASPVNTYPITASGAVDNNYAITYADGTLTIGQAALTVTADNKGSTYGQALPALTVSYDGFVNGDTESSLTTAATAGTTASPASPVNTYPITASGAVDNNYAITYTNGTLTIGQARLTVIADNKNSIYGQALPAFTVSYAGFVNGDTPESLTTAPTAVTTATAASPVNTYLITPGGAVDNNYAITYTNGNLTIGQAALTITANNQNSTYGQALPALTVSYAGFVNGDTPANLTIAATSATIATVASPVNTYAITPGGAVDNNYAITYTNGTLTIGLRAITVAAIAQTKNYGDTDPALSYHVTSGSLFGTDAFTGALTREPGENVGSYAITAGTLALNSNYNLTFAGTDLAIGQRAIIVTADAQSKNYGDTDPVLSYQITTGNLIGTDTFTGMLTRAPGENVGNYAITEGTLALNSNYNLRYNGANLTVNQRGITVIATAANKHYGDPDPAFAYTTDVPLISGDSFTGALTRDPGENVGDYAITEGTLALSNNYNLAYAGANLTIGRTALTVTADNKARNFGTANPNLTVNYTGFVNGDTQNNLTTQAIATTTANQTTAPGSYAITASGATSANYTITNVNGTLTIIPLTNAQLINLTTSTGTLSPAFTPSTTTYSASVGYQAGDFILTPTYDATASATINGTAVPNGSPSFSIPLVAGTNVIPLVVTAQDGTTKTTYTLNVYLATPPSAMIPTNILSPNGDGKNDGWVIKDIQLYPNSTVTIYDKAGRAVYTKRNYTNDWTGTVNGAPLAQGTYFYIVQLGPTELKGYITILTSH